MRPLDDAELLAWTAGALDPDHALAIADRYAADPALQARVALLPAAPAPLPVTWVLPPPRRSALTVGPTLSGALRPGGRFTVPLSDHSDPDAHHVVVLYRRGGDWVVLFPEAAPDRLMLSALPVGAGATRQLTLSAQPEPGEQHWAVVLVPDSLPVDWSQPAPQRWAPLQAALRAGDLSAARFSVAVST